MRKTCALVGAWSRELAATLARIVSETYTTQSRVEADVTAGNVSVGERLCSVQSAVCIEDDQQVSVKGIEGPTSSRTEGSLSYRGRGVT